MLATPPYRVEPALSVTHGSHYYRQPGYSHGICRQSRRALRRASRPAIRKRKLLPSLFNLVQTKLPDNFAVVGVSATTSVGAPRRL
jgi:hypothetical protein